MQTLAAAEAAGALPASPRLRLCSSLFLSKEKSCTQRAKGFPVVPRKALWCRDVLHVKQTLLKNKEIPPSWFCVVDSKLVWMNISGGGAELLH